MNYRNQKIERLLRSATQAREERPAAMPFGFDTRVVALSSGSRRMPKPSGATSLLRGIALLSAAVIVISTLAAVREARQSREQFGDSLTNEFAIADSAIHDEFLR